MHKGQRIPGCGCQSRAKEEAHLADLKLKRHGAGLRRDLRQRIAGRPELLPGLRKHDRALRRSGIRDPRLLEQRRIIPVADILHRIRERIDRAVRLLQRLQDLRTDVRGERRVFLQIWRQIQRHALLFGVGNILHISVCADDVRCFIDRKHIRGLFHDDPKIRRGIIDNVNVRVFCLERGKQLAHTDMVGPASAPTVHEADGHRLRLRCCGAGRQENAQKHEQPAQLPFFHNHTSSPVQLFFLLCYHNRKNGKKARERQGYFYARTI